VIDLINNNLAGFWFTLGFLLLAIEILAFAFGTGVLLFGGIGALITGALLATAVVPATWLAAVASFALASVATAILLWWPLKKLQSGAKLGQDRSSDLIGHTFYLDSDLTPRQPSKTRYSGVDWKVLLADASEEDFLSSGTKVTVTAVNAGMFQVERQV